MAISAKEYLRRLSKVNKITVLREIASELILKEESAIKTLKEQDFLEGDIYGDGKTLLEYRSVNYEIFKSKLNPTARGAVDLILTGKFVESMFLNKPKQGRYTFGNSDSKAGILRSKYGQGIFSLNQNVFDKFQKDIIAPKFVIDIKKTANIA